MSLKKELRQELKEAMKAGNALRKKAIRLALAEIKNAEIEKGAELEEHEIRGVLQKEVKARQETIEGAEQAQRDDLIQEAEAEIEVLREFLPEPLSEEELRDIVQQVIDDVQAASMRDMGKVMGALMPRIKGRADGKVANQMVREILS
jgi:hypothetical protein